MRPPQLSENPTVPVVDPMLMKTFSLPCSVPAHSGIMTSCLPGNIIVNAMSAQSDVSPVTNGVTYSVPASSGIMTSSLQALPQTVINLSSIGGNLDADSVPACSGIMTSPSLAQAASVVDSAFPAPGCSLDLDTPQPKPALPLLKMATLKSSFFHFNHRGVEKFFLDKRLPSSSSPISQDKRFGSDYFVTLSLLTAAAGPSWGEDTPNFRGARVKLAHTDLRIDCWRHHLLGYESRELCQFLE